jgi:hypothetical protein
MNRWLDIAGHRVSVDDVMIHKEYDAMLDQTMERYDIQIMDFIDIMERYDKDDVFNYFPLDCVVLKDTDDLILRKFYLYVDVNMKSKYFNRMYRIQSKKLLLGELLIFGHQICFCYQILIHSMRNIM